MSSSTKSRPLRGQTVECSQCGASLYRPPSQLGKKNYFCNNSCKSSFRKREGRWTTLCVDCGSPFELWKSSQNQDIRVKRCKSCRRKAKFLEKTCEGCGSSYTVNALREASSRFCSRVCSNRTTSSTRVLTDESKRGLGWKRGVGAGFYRDLDGYVILTMQPPHFLSRTGSIAEHRLVLFDKIGPDKTSCHWCGCSLEWFPEAGSGSAKIEADHLDGVVDNNVPENIVQSCKPCNAGKTRLRRGVEEYEAVQEG